MAVTTTKTFTATAGQTAFTPVGIELNNHADLDVYVTKASAGIAANNNKRILHLNSSSTSTLDANHVQVNDTTGLYFPAITHSGGTETLNNYTISTDNNTITFNSALSAGDIVYIERRGEDGSGDYTTFATGSTIRAGDLNTAFDEVKFQAQEARNKAITLEGQIDYGDITVGTGGGIVFEGATNDAHETTLTVTDPTADRTITLPNETGTVITSAGTDVIDSAHYVAGSIDLEHMSANSVDSAQYVDGSIDLVHMSANSVDSDQYVDGSIDLVHMSANSVDSAQYVDGSIDRVHLAADIVDGTKIADDSINSEHYVDGSIDHEHLATGIIQAENIAANNITNALMADNAIDSAEIVAGAIDLAHMSANSVDSDQYVDGSIDLAHMSANSVDSDQYVDGSIDHVHLANDIIDGDNIQDDVINSEHIAAGAVDLEHMSANSVDSDQYVDGSIDRVHLSADIIDATKIADDAVTTDHIQDAELVTLAGMQSGTASKLVSGTLTSDIADLNQIDGMTKETSVTDDDAKFPTSGAVVDYVAAQLAPVGGFEVIATDAAFPNTQPASGVVISIADAGGLVVNGSGTSTTGRTVGGSTVTINNINSQFNSTTIADGVAMMVSSTGSSQTYNYHKATLKEADLLSLSNDINDFAARYRVANTAPSSSLDEGDLWWDMAINKLKVYDGSAWGEVASSGDFYINTISSYSGTGGNSATFNGSAYRFVLSNPGSTAQQHIVSINGVIQKPNSGTSQPSEGFAISGTSIIFSNAPASGSDYFICTIGDAISIGTPSDNTVSTAKIQNLAVTTAKIAADAVDGTKIADDSINSEHYVDGSIDTAHLADLNVTTGKIAADAITGAKIADDAVGAEHIEVLDANLQLADNVKIQIGTGNDLEIYHDGGNSWVKDAGTGALYIDTDGAAVKITKSGANENMAVFNTDGAVELYHNNVRTFFTDAEGIRVYGPEGGEARIRLYADEADDNADLWRLEADTSGNFNLHNYAGGSWERSIACAGGGNVELFYDDSKKLETTSWGADVTGKLRADTLSLGDDEKLQIGAGDDLEIYHNGTDSYIKNLTGGLNLSTADGSHFSILGGANMAETSARFNDNGAVKLYHDNSLKLETIADGVEVTGSLVSSNISGRNIIVNGAMNISQRRTSTTTHNAFVCDRWRCGHNGADEAPTFAKVSLTSSDTGPWAAGFRHAMQITNGNQTGGAGGADYCRLSYITEAQDMASSGWDYTSSSSYITLSFWVKASVSQVYNGFLRSADGTQQQYPFSTPTLSANTWTKITKVIPGAANVQFDNNQSNGLEIYIQPFDGTDHTASGVTNDAWAAYSGTAKMKDFASTWWTTNDATFALTGVQLELGKVATPFDHAPYHQEILRCYRYYQNSYSTHEGDYPGAGDQYDKINGISWADGNGTGFHFYTGMRGAPSVTLWNGNTSGQVNSSGNDRSAAAGDVNSKSVKYINVTNGADTSWLDYQWEADSEI